MRRVIHFCFPCVFFSVGGSVFCLLLHRIAFHSRFVFLLCYLLLFVVCFQRFAYNFCLLFSVLLACPCHQYMSGNAGKERVAFRCQNLLFGLHCGCHEHHCSCHYGPIYRQHHVPYQKSINIMCGIPTSVTHCVLLQKYYRFYCCHCSHCLSVYKNHWYLHYCFNTNMSLSQLTSEG